MRFFSISLVGSAFAIECNAYLFFSTYSILAGIAVGCGYGLVLDVALSVRLSSLFIPKLNYLMDLLTRLGIILLVVS